MVTAMSDGRAISGVVEALADTRFTDLRWFDEVDSTNRVALDEARRGTPEGLVVLAGTLTAGRGRLGRSWSAPPGSALLTSILLRPSLPADRLHLLTAAVALSASDACLKTGGFRPGLKWPNDLVVDGSLLGVEGDRKLAGVLAESVAGASGIEAVVVGIGINLRWPRPLPPELAALESTAIDAAGVVGRKVDAGRTLVQLLARLEERLRALEEPEGWRTVASEHRARCTTLNRAVRVELPTETFTGVAADLTDEGHLLVDVGACLRTVVAGDVVHLRVER